MLNQTTKLSAFERLQNKAFLVGYKLEKKGRYTQLRPHRSWYSPTKWLSIFFICLGIWLISTSDSSNSELHELLIQIALGVFVAILGILIFIRYSFSLLKWNSNKIISRHYFRMISISRNSDLSLQVYTKRIRMEDGLYVTHSLVAIESGTKHELFSLTDLESESGELYEMCIGLKREILAGKFGSLVDSN